MVLDGAGRKVPKYVKLQAEKWLEIADGNVYGVYVDEKAVDKITKLLGLMIHPDLQCPMNEGLEDYAWFFDCSRTMHQRKRPGRTEIRYYDTAVLEICRKNFKTFNAAVIFILLMLTDHQFSRFFQ